MLMVFAAVDALVFGQHVSYLVPLSLVLLAAADLFGRRQRRAIVATRALTLVGLLVLAAVVVGTLFFDLY